MQLKKTLLLSLCFLTLQGGDVVMMDQPYYKKDVRNTEIIYTQQNLPFAQYTASVEEALQPLYEAMFGYKMDEKLSVVLASSYNQIPNGFSTQIPNNRQLNYMGGVLLVDYFSATSWLDTLLYHETAHNYQMNEKDNVVSSSLHSVFANGVFFVPWFTVPNLFESSFMAEGNAVLNESWHGKGGRLYNGEFKIEALMQAKAGKLTPELLYNDNYNFLYGSHFYTLGGYYFYYLAKRYGLKKANAYWKYHSHYWFWPFFTNNPMKSAVGVDFETSVLEWAKEMREEAKQVVQTHGEPIVSSQFFLPMNDDARSIYFLVNESGRDLPELIVYDKKSGSVTKEKSGWLDGKVIRLQDRYVTQSYNYTDPWRIYIGLFDSDAELIPGSGSKVIEGYLSDTEAVYFDVPTSYKEPKLYVGNKFYTTVNSSVFIHHDDLYYFVQNDKTRTLYKNKTALTSFRGYYGHVVGVDSQGGVYFIANTRHGSGLYRYFDKKVTQASPADTIIDARLIDDTHALVATVGSDAYAYEKIKLQQIDRRPYEVKLFVESKPYYRKADPKIHPQPTPKLDLKRSFTPFLDMRYSATNLLFGEDTKAGFIYDVSFNFADPMTLNALGMFVSRGTDEYTLAGASYSNDQYFVNFLLSGYAVVDKPASTSAANDNYGVFALASVPFLRHGYWSGSMSAGYYKDYQADTRQPLSMLLSVQKYEQFGVSLYPHLLAGAEAYYSNDRGSGNYGGKLRFSKGFEDEVYAKVNLKYSKSDRLELKSEKGVKVAKSIAESLKNADPSTIMMPALKNTLYVNDAFKSGVDLKKVFNFDAYYFTFPISLRREALTMGYTYYNLHQNSTRVHDNEYKLGILFDTYWFNMLPVPVTAEYRYNDNQEIAQRHNFRIFAGVSF